MSHYKNLEVGERVVLHEKQEQREIEGTVREREDCGDNIRYVVEFDSGDHYYVLMLKKHDN